MITMKKNVLLLFLFGLFTIPATAQKLPDWIINKPTPTNNTYLYVVESATGQTELQARNRAIAEVFRSTAMRIGQPIDSEEINRALQRGTEYYVISSQYNVPINKVCEYTDNKTSPCRVYVLCQVAKAGNIHVQFDDFNACYEGANKVYADEALYADGFTISQNGKILSDREIRTLFANSKSYQLYDRGLRLRNGMDNGMGACFLGASLSLFCQLGWLGYYDGKWDSQIGKSFVVYGSTATGILLAGGIICGIVKSASKSNIRKAVDLYNNGRLYSQTDLELNYSFTPTGVYLTLQF